MGRKSNTAGQADSITAGVNEGRFITHMQHLFSSSAVFLAELMQNARRAGASAIQFNLEGDTLTVTDDGCGIEDFAKLVVIAESGWSEEVMASEDPFGIGFASVAFAAARVTVESRGKGIEFDKTDLIAKRPIARRNSDFIGGTRVVLSGLTYQSIEHQMEKFAKGFPIPVWFNGKELPRPHALENLSGAHATPVGHIQIAYVEEPGQALMTDTGWVYCQGLPVNAGSFTDRYNRSDNIVHIDHKLWRPRVPDRDTLVDADKACSAIRKAIAGVWLGWMLQDKGNLTPESFVSRYWRMAHKLGRQDILNDVPALPSDILAIVRDYPVDQEFGSNIEIPGWPALTRQKIECGKVRLCTEVDAHLEGDNFARLMLIMEKQWVMIEQLPEGHWARAHVIDMATLPVEVKCEELASGIFYGDWVGSKVAIARNLRVAYSIGGASEEVVIADPIATDTCIYVPEGCSSPARVLRQASSYLDENENYRETEHDLDCDEFDNLVAELSGEPPAVTLSKCLAAGKGRERNNLRGKRFVCIIDAEGTITVKEQEDGAG